ncbi:MAG: PilZ domain-containing protein [Candidatus Omnitrophota bacterium]
MGLPRILRTGRVMVRKLRNEINKRKKNLLSFQQAAGKHVLQRSKVIIDDRRKYFRLEALLDGTFNTASGNKGLIMLKDITRDGIRACLDKKVNIGQLINMEIWFPGKVATAYAQGKVVWLRKSKKDWAGKFDAGVRFERMAPDDKYRILDYAYEYWKQAKI